ncbi:MAG: hypothetical protein AAGI48_11160 [Verrucomicrobiota bacterium]
MPDESESNPNLPSRHRPRLSELSKQTTEEDLWDLEEDHLSEASGKTGAGKAAPDEPGQLGEMPVVGEPKKPAARKRKLPPEPREPAPKAPDTSIGTKKEPPPEPVESEPVKASRPHGPNPHDLKTIENAPEPAPQLKQQEEPKPAPAAKDASPKKEKAEVAAKEKIGLIALTVVFVGVAAWWLTSLFSSVPTTRIGDDQPDYPVEGNYLTVESGVTYWREPNRDGPRPDVAKADVEFLPVLSLTLKEGNAGILRAIFRDELGDFVGDSISHRFSAGVFEANANSTIEFAATDGFSESGEFNGYLVGESRWTVEVFEGPSADAAGSEFKLLLTAPVSPNRQ